MKSGAAAGGSSAASSAQLHANFIMIKSTMNACLGQLLSLITEILNKEIRRCLKAEASEDLMQVFKQAKNKAEVIQELSDSETMATILELC